MSNSREKKKVFLRVVLKKEIAWPNAWSPFVFSLDMGIANIANCWRISRLIRGYQVCDITEANPKCALKVIIEMFKSILKQSRNQYRGAEKGVMRTRVFTAAFWTSWSLETNRVFLLSSSTLLTQPDFTKKRCRMGPVVTALRLSLAAL